MLTKINTEKVFYLEDSTNAQIEWRFKNIPLKAIVSDESTIHFGASNMIDGFVLKPVDIQSPTRRFRKRKSKKITITTEGHTYHLCQK